MADLFEEKSKDWDSNDIVQNISSSVGESILSHLTLNTQMNVMDFGAGTGLICHHIAPLVKKITAVDISQSMLDKLVKKATLAAKVEAVCQDITKKPLNQQFDLIVSAMALHHINDTDQLLDTFQRHLKPGAKVALADLDSEDGSFHPKGTEGIYHHGFKREELQGSLEKNGFSQIKFINAHTIVKAQKRYSVFLVIATKT